MKGSKRVARLQAKAKAATQAKATTAPRVVAYLRVSTEEQATHGHGLDSQEKAVRSFASSQGYDLVEVVSDPGVSGSTRPSTRPGFGRVLELAVAGEFTTLLVWKFDRLARELRFAVETVAELAEKHEVDVRSVTEPIDTGTPMGRMVFAILAGMAEGERYAIRDRTGAGRVQKATKGGLAGGRAPYGYRYVGAAKERTLEIVPDQARIVRRIYEARKRKATLQAIADELNGEGVPSPEGKRWHPSGVARVLDNPKYAGHIEYLFTWTGTATHVLTKGAHAPIIARVA